jgi:hypothetical protein
MMMHADFVLGGIKLQLYTHISSPLGKGFTEFAGFAGFTDCLAYRHQAAISPLRNVFTEFTDCFVPRNDGDTSPLGDSYQ